MLRRNLLRIAGVAGHVLLVALLSVVGKAWWDSRLPGTYSVMDYGTHDFGGGSEPAGHDHGGAGGISVSDLRGPRSGAPDTRFELAARSAEIRLASGRRVQALTFNGSSPGPELRVRQGDLVEVELSNADVEDGVTIHWHGVDVPNAEDGVAGVTQNAVLPGERYTYRFRAEQRGTFWYHTHQVSSKEVRRGLFGVLVIEASEPSATERDVALAVHTFDGVPTINGSDELERMRVEPGTPVRLRLVNTDSFGQQLTVTGAAFRVSAIDGTDLSAPAPLENRTLALAGGGRYDVSFVMPESPVGVTLLKSNAAVALSADGHGDAPGAPPGPDFDPLSYGRPAPTPFDASSDFDRRFELKLTRKPGFFDGRPGRQWALNGGIYPDVPVFVVEEGDLVEMTVTNDTNVVHPMHLHGHHVLVLGRDGVAATGSPWWSDTLNVLPGESYVVAFRADNPGIWMDHCHNLPHAAKGLTMHVAYAGVTTPFVVGGEPGNAPE